MTIAQATSTPLAAWRLTGVHLVSDLYPCITKMAKIVNSGDLNLLLFK
jgi:hypothetical protein